jgi:hypothetical protein
LQHLQIKVLCTTANFPRRRQVHDLHVAFKLPYMWLYNRIMQATSRCHTKSWKCKCSQHWIRQSP